MIVRQQEDDLGSLVRFMRDFNDRQSQLFYMLLTFLARHPSVQSRHPAPAAERYLTPDLQSLVDDDVIADRAPAIGHSTGRRSSGKGRSGEGESREFHDGGCLSGGG